MQLALKTKGPSMPFPTIKFDGAADVLTKIGGAGAGLAALWVAARKTAKTVKQLRGMAGAVALIADELKPNGGATIRDQLNRIERNQSLSDARQRAIVHEASAAMYETDAHGKNLWVNTTYADMVGRDPQALLGNGWILCVKEEDRYKVEQEWEAAVSHERPFEMSYRVFNAVTFEAFLVTDRARPLRCVRGEVIGYFGLVQVEKEPQAKGGV